MDKKTDQLFRRILKDKSLRVTTQRLLVVNMLWDKGLQSISQLEKALLGSLDRTSIYRTINLFEGLGIVRRVMMGWKYKIELTDVLGSHHHHISCIECGFIMPIKEHDLIEDLVSKLAAKYDLHPKQHDFEIQGYCKNCKNS